MSLYQKNNRQEVIQVDKLKKCISPYSILLIISIVLIILLYITKEILFFPFAGLTGLAMIFTAILKTGKWIDEAINFEEIVGAIIACLFATFIPIAIVFIGFIRVDSL